MRCPECQQEVVLARQCPYCGAAVPQEGPSGLESEGGQDHPRGRFQGRLEGGSESGAGVGGHDRRPQPAGFLGRLARYLLHPQVPLGSKLLLVLAGFYLLSPLDLIPGLFPLSWIDDLGLVGVLWWWLSRELDRYP